MDAHDVVYLAICSNAVYVLCACGRRSYGRDQTEARAIHDRHLPDEPAEREPA